jgi:drug/metabolite transporter (DMT)-like permease
MDKVIDGFVSLLTAMVALSVGVERVVEIVKGFSAWLRSDPDPSTDPDGRKAAWRRLTLQSIAMFSGTAIVATIEPQRFLPTILPAEPNPTQFWAASVLLGLMASGGSAFWNHALDLIGAAKSAKEAVTKSLQTHQPADAPAPSTNPQLLVGGGT